MKTLSRVEFLPDSPKRRTTLIPPNGVVSNNARVSHMILQVKLQNDELYAIDISGAQYGFREPIYPWHIYEKSRIASMIAMKTLTNLKQRERLTGKKKRGGKPGKRMEVEFAKVVDDAVETWQSCNTTIAALSKMRNGEFESKREELLGFISEKISQHKNEMIQNGRLEV